MKISQLMFSVSSGLTVGAAALVSVPALAQGPLEFQYSAGIPEISDADYQALVQPVANPTRFMFITSGQPLGLLGFDVGIGATGFSIPEEATAKFKTYIEGGDKIPSFAAIPRVTAQKGLPFGIDVAINAAVVPDSSLKLIGAGVQYTAFDGVWPLPSLSARAAYSTFVGLDELSTQSYNAEAVAGFNLLIVEPYAGIGMSQTKTESKFTILNTQQTKTAEWNDTYGIAGARLSVLPFLGIAAEIQTSSIQTLYTGKLSFKF